MKKSMPSFLLVLLLSGCISAAVLPKPVEAPEETCPPLVRYNSAQEAELATELERIPSNSMIVTTLSDYHAVRKRCGVVG